MRSDRDGAFAPGKLWSLLEMLQIDTNLLVKGVHRLRENMEVAKNDPSQFSDKSADMGLRFWIGQLAPELERLDLRQSAKKLSYVDRSLTSAVAVPTDVYARFISQQIEDFRERLFDELEDRKIYCMSGKQSDYLTNAVHGFGPEVAAAFPNVEYDLEEAAKTLSFERGTATVFHLMRAMDLALTALGEKLSATVRDKDGKPLVWGKIIANCRGKIEGMPDDDAKDAWDSAMSLLFHVKEVWRNTTMHPMQKYTVEEATEVFEACRAFMRRLAPLV
ncbi:hypothetical protein ACFSOZ_08565 [Mesorhizobium newzealandense]|uniref:TIGR02391 family protein n=1 Tax=Mesorhizobium newzealandense TaxID=1300302 RepID=A0ABW4U5C9_9HYPH